MSIRVSGGGGGGGIPGVTSDGRMPGGEVIAGALTAGDANAATVPAFHNINGTLYLNDTPANYVDGDSLLQITQQNNLDAVPSFIAAVSVARSTPTSPASTAIPLIDIFDGSNLAHSLSLSVRKSTNPTFRVTQDGSIGIFGHTAPDTQPVLATGTGHTVDDVIALLQSYGFCKQS